MADSFERVVRERLARQPQPYREVVESVDWPAAVAAIAAREDLDSREARWFLVECAAIIAFGLERDEPLSSKLTPYLRLVASGSNLELARKLGLLFEEEVLGGTLNPLRSMGVMLVGETQPAERQSMFADSTRRLRVTSTRFECGVLSRHISMVSEAAYSVEPGRRALFRRVPEQYVVFVDVDSDRIGRHDPFHLRFPDSETALLLHEALSRALEIDRFRNECDPARGSCKTPETGIAALRSQ